MTEKALTVRTITPTVWQQIQAIAPVLYQSRLFRASSPEQAMAIMLKGYELGLPLTASFELIHVVQGRPSLSPRGALAIVMRSGELDGMRIEDQPDACTVWMRRKNGLEYQCTWTMEDAKRAGVVKPDGSWQTYPANMLRWRAIGFCLDVLFADIIGGLRRADELGAQIDEDGNVIEGEWTVSTPVSTPPNGHAGPTVTLEQLVERYGADAVLAANGGRIPATDDEVAAVAAQLETADA